MKVDSRPIGSDSALAPVDEVQAVTRSRAAQFEAVLPAPGGEQSRRSLRRDVERLGESGRVEPSLFAGSRPTEILEDILERIVPSLDLDADTRSLAMTLIHDEIETRRSLDQQRSDSGE